MYAVKAIDSEVNMCDYCQNEFPTCDPELVEFGDGIGNDNVTVCSDYIPRRYFNNYPITSAPERGRFERKMYHE